MAIRKEDWGRLKTMLGELVEAASWMTTAANIFFGAGISAILGGLPLRNTPGLEPWLLPSYFIGGAACMIIASFMWAGDFAMRRERGRQRTYIQRDMAAIEQRFGQLN